MTLRERLSSSPRRYVCIFGTHRRTLLMPVQREWELRDGRIYFPVEEAEKEAVSSNNIINNTIGYAQELETIV